MQFSIITPSFRNSAWLKLCVASVADQEGVSKEHIVQDAGSDDGTLDWLLKDPRVATYVEKDTGMYDAVNRGFKRAKGDIVAYLNCDEQYLPGALEKVRDFFAIYPDIDVLFGDAIVVDANGKYVCHRKALMPFRPHMWYRFPVLTCGIFLRREVLDRYGVYFDPKWRVIGDLFWVMDMVNRKVPMAVLHHFTSTFADTRENLSLQPEALDERQMMLKMPPAWVRRLRLAVIFHHRLRMLLNGSYSQKPFEYSVYTTQSPERRVVFRVDKPTGLWRGRTDSLLLRAEWFQTQS